MADVNGTLKTLTGGLVGLIPNVGAFAASVFSLLWPDTPVDYWGQVKEQVYAAIKEGLNEAKVQQLKDLLEGTKDNFQEYVATTDHEEKKTRCVALDVVLTELKHQFMDESLESVVYFVQYAVLHISVNVDILLFYDDDKNRQDLNDLINEYSTYAHKMKPRLVQNRLGQIDTQCRLEPDDPLVIKHNTKESIGSDWSLTVKVTSYGVAQDHNTGKDLVFAAFMISTLHPYGAPVHEEIQGGKAQCRRQLQEYRAKIERETNAHWQENLIDPIDLLKNAKVLES